MPTDFDYVAGDITGRTAEEKKAEAEAEERERARGRWRRRWGVLKGSTKTIVFLLLVALFLWVFRYRMFYSVDSGEVLLIYYRLFGGTSHNQVGREGLHIIAPWDLAYRYKIRTQTLLIPMKVMSRDGLEVDFEAQIRFNVVPETVPYLHRRYGPDYVRTIIIPQLSESVQGVVGQFHAEELYSFNRAATTGRIFARARRLIGGVYVHVEDISLFNLALPSRVQSAIQQKMEAEQAALAAQFSIEKEKRETERKRIEAEGLASFSKNAIPQSVLVWKGIEATLELAKSPNAKVVVMGGKDNLPLVLGNVPDVAGK